MRPADVAHNMTIQPSVLIQRFMLNLREVGTSANTTSMTGTEQPSGSDANFRVPSSFLGNIGESLDSNLTDRYDYEDSSGSEVFEEGGENGFDKGIALNSMSRAVESTSD